MTSPQATDPPGAHVRVRLLSPSEVIVSGDATLAAWRDRHCIMVPGYQFTPQFKRGRWDGTYTPGKFGRWNGETFEIRCSIGLLPRILTDLDAASLRAPLMDRAEIDAFLATTPTAARLRDYQRDALTRVLSAGWGRVAYATNAGKGAVIALLAAFAAGRKVPVLILCDEVAVFDALCGEIETWSGIAPALVRRGVKVPPRAHCTLAMVPTLARRIRDDKDGGRWRRWLEEHGMLLLDEADKADAPTWRAILTTAKNSWWRAGFSGTFPTDLYHDVRFDELMGPIVARVTNAEMVERGVSARPIIELYAYDVTGAVHPLPSPREWWNLTPTEKRALVYERAIMTNAERHAFVRSLIRPGAPTAIIVNRLEHGEVLARSIDGAVFLDGSTSERERIETLDAFKAGAVPVIVVTKILDRGTNRLGHATDLIFASGEGSRAQTLQRIGRGLRRADGKASLRLVDIMDRMTLDGRDKRSTIAAAFLHSAVKRRLMVYTQEGFEVRINAAT